MIVNLDAISGVETEGTVMLGIRAMQFRPPNVTSLFGLEGIQGS